MIDFIPIPNSNLIDQLRFEYNHLGPSMYLVIAEMLVKQHDYRLPISDSNVGIIAEKLRIDESKVKDILNDLANETSIFNKELFNQDILSCPELERILTKIKG